MYNTGRALHKCQELFEEKREVLPAPDYLITSVGTKVCFEFIRIHSNLLSSLFTWHRGVKCCQRQTASSPLWAQRCAS